MQKNQKKWTRTVSCPNHHKFEIEAKDVQYGPDMSELVNESKCVYSVICPVCHESVVLTKLDATVAAAAKEIYLKPQKPRSTHKKK